MFLVVTKIFKRFTYFKLMYLYKRLLLITILFGFFNIVFGTCSLYDSDIFVDLKVDGKDVGVYNQYDDLYVKGDLNDYPITLIFNIKTNEDCLNETNVEFKLTQNGLFKSPDQFSKENIESLGYFSNTATFNFQENVILNNDFIGTLHLNEIGEINFQFRIDEDDPLFTSNPKIDNFEANYLNNNILKSGEKLLNFNVLDSGSGIKSVSISNLYNNDSINQSSFSFSKSFDFTSNQNLVIEVEDKLGNTITRSLNVSIDTQPPSVSSINVLQGEGKREVDVNVEVNDDSFSYDNWNSDDFYCKANFRELNGEDVYVNSDNILNVDGTVICSWNRISTDNLEHTSVAEILFNISDFSGKNISTTMTTSSEIVADRDPPVIEEFKLINNLGNENIISPYLYEDSNTLLYLRVSDESGVDSIDLDLGESTSIGGITNSIVNQFDQNLSDTENGLFVWNLTDLEREGVINNLFENPNSDNIVQFAVRVKDIYNQWTELEFLNITVDSELPVVNDSEYKDQNLNERIIKGDLMYSGANMIYTIKVKDNLGVDINNIYGDFSRVASDPSNSVDLKPSCQMSSGDSNLLECDFTNIHLRNGYVNETVFIKIYDLAGNIRFYNESIEIFKVGNESRESFYVNFPISSYNPLPRDKLLDGVDTTAWFKGEFLKREGEDDIVLMNFVLIDCQITNNSILVLQSRELYPSIDGVVKGTNKFNLKAEVKSGQNINQLNTEYNEMSCLFEIRKRDNSTIYPPELVNVTFRYNFYNIPRGNLITAHAEELKEMAEDAEILGSWYDTFMNYYNMYANICRVGNTGLGVVSSVAQTIAAIDAVISGGNFGKGFYCTQGQLSDLVKTAGNAIDKFCAFATCDYWNKILGENKVLDYISEVEDSVNDVLGCGVDNGDSKKSKKKLSSISSSLTKTNNYAGNNYRSTYSTTS